MSGLLTAGGEQTQQKVGKGSSLSVKDSGCPEKGPGSKAGVKFISKGDDDDDHFDQTEANRPGGRDG